jgi:Flp pilus assembly protein TadG
MALTTDRSFRTLTKSRAARPKLENHRGPLRKNRRGAAAVEFAIVLPVFILLVFGMIEYGRMVMVQQVITNASREGARRAVLDGATAVGGYLADAKISGGTCKLNPLNPASADSGGPITVTVEVPFNAVSWLPSPMYLGGKTLSAATTMRRESVE